ncbi:pyridoxamine 5'-phosphate oxidase [Cryptococcus gattii Ru294]|uniref:pyridoxal 5'-phosphate synthase n=2 Tax=Cryptococcus gattii TaxID=37769 RepID=E6REN6_CRYGW|nr:Pyridoxamine-phosphate oxidase, putative [Cryptococcus gattii WM276]KIR51814.1 pyridoxamine 5'-phosphate oxidase [Cryptococcus gattii Ru294]KIR76697.1 pyridoxamine 5'-phosphate oxidase [Cryptococcus gattii EJB2]KIY31644.1 pyridoxamine 5'-phosphate oxidase [Cryptococcus gattii E566]KJE01100.1 pyridoxamine 5'-phosphate oxidase [Cryptococcus gattii NT-10]ADV25228.1 Pyridoxamine-phosphate oxidase, putative [Cryptococcus gattii WM276]
MAFPRNISKILKTIIPINIIRTMSTQHVFGTSSTSSHRSASFSAPETVKLITHNQYLTPRLLASELSPNPLLQFNAWFASALQPSQGEVAAGRKVNEPEAMTLSTATAQGIPSSRIVLLKTVDKTGFVFFTNYTSRKSEELLANPYAALTFYWREVSRQVRVVGKVEKVSREESVEYFNTRPRGSRLGAWASKQSQPVEEGQLEEWVKSEEERWEGKEVECPKFWGGWRVVPFEVEFWSGQPSRLHDRFRYTRPEGSDGEWEIKKLSP